MQSNLRFAIGLHVDGFELLETVRGTTSALNIYRGGNTIALGFMQTIGPIFPPSPDWLENLKCWKKSLSFGADTVHAHAGFVEDYKLLWLKVESAIHIYDPKLIIITGFSQGSSVATLSFRDIIYNHQSIAVQATLYASPRVYAHDGANEFEDALKRRLDCSFERISWRGDLVTGLPPWFMGFKHVGKERFVGSGHPLVRIDATVHNQNKYLEELEK